MIGWTKPLIRAALEERYSKGLKGNNWKQLSQNYEQFNSVDCLVIKKKQPHILAAALNEIFNSIFNNSSVIYTMETNI